MSIRALASVSVLTAAMALSTWTARPAPPLGFTRDRAAAYARLERTFLGLPDADRIRTAHQFLTAEPHLAGTPRDLELALWTRETFLEAGLEDVAITAHEVLLPWPRETVVEMVAPNAWRASMRETDRDDRRQAAPQAFAALPYHAYSASGDVTAPVVYVGSGRPEDYDRLETLGVSVKGRIAIVRQIGITGYRGYKLFTAERRGAAAVLMYPGHDSAPAMHGNQSNVAYSEARIERGGVGYDFLVPGDPSTPGWPSVPGARRIRAEDATVLPRIPSAPISRRDARAILAAMTGTPAPAPWREVEPAATRIGGGLPILRVRVQTDQRIRPVWTVTAVIRGRDEPERAVILGNHRDAWVYGGVDPSSGSAALMELARAFGEMKRSGWRPRRSIVFASWDAEEFALTSSTEWGEQHERYLDRSAVAYLNVDSAASGRVLSASAVPALNRVFAEAAETVRDPFTRASLAAAIRDRISRARGVAPEGRPGELLENRLGSGSDYTVFLNFLGVPVADLSFTGPYDVYHSSFDTHEWVSGVGDPGFRYHVALVQLWGVMVLRLAEADVVPLDYEAYADALTSFVDELERRYPPWTRNALRGTRRAIGDFRAAAAEFCERRTAALARGDGPAIEVLNSRILRVERAFLNRDGIPGRPWFRHLVYAPTFSYTPEVLPGIAEAAELRDRPRAETQAGKLATAIRRAAECLR